jgi:hypothetical protein
VQLLLPPRLILENGMTTIDEFFATLRGKAQELAGGRRACGIAG